MPKDRHLASAIGCALLLTAASAGAQAVPAAPAPGPATGPVLTVGDTAAIAARNFMLYGAMLGATYQNALTAGDAGPPDVSQYFVNGAAVTTVPKEGQPGSQYYVNGAAATTVPSAPPSAPPSALSEALPPPIAPQADAGAGPSAAMPVNDASVFDASNLLDASGIPIGNAAILQAAAPVGESPEPLAEEFAPGELEVEHLADAAVAATVAHPTPTAGGSPPLPPAEGELAAADAKGAGFPSFGSSLRQALGEVAGDSFAVLQTFARWLALAAVLTGAGIFWWSRSARRRLPNLMTHDPGGSLDGLDPPP
jgi:hypothetical protein